MKKSSSTFHNIKSSFHAKKCSEDEGWSIYLLKGWVIFMVIGKDMGVGKGYQNNTGKTSGYKI